jgi:molybdenum cofactor synthesis domain-containing protein
VRAGSDVFDLVYTRDTRLKKFLAPVARALEADLDDERLVTVLRAAAERFGWVSGRVGAGQGIACGLEKGGRVAAVAEVGDVEGSLLVIRPVTAYECRTVVNPDTVINQIEGATVMALGGALFEAIRFTDGAITNGSFSDYRVPRFHDVPPIEVVVLKRPDLASAEAGETPMIAARRASSTPSLTFARGGCGRCRWTSTVRFIADANQVAPDATQGGTSITYARGMVLAAKILTVSDSVDAGRREDKGGSVLASRLEKAGYQIVDRRVVPDGVGSVARALEELARDFAGLIVTTGGTGFSPRDLTPEATLLVLDREAPGLGEAMRSVSPLGRLSRARAGTAGQSLILNTPGSPVGALESLEAVLDILPHALELLCGEASPHPSAAGDKTAHSS